MYQAIWIVEKHVLLYYYRIIDEVLPAARLSCFFSFVSRSHRRSLYESHGYREGTSRGNYFIIAGNLFLIFSSYLASIQGEIQNVCMREILAKLRYLKFEQWSDRNERRIIFCLEYQNTKMFDISKKKRKKEKEQNNLNVASWSIYILIYRYFFEMN